ncbi:MAG TPA: hypothetical protein VGB92_09240 [Longimicrobium sp.]|jgi:hypothetical protein
MKTRLLAALAFALLLQGCAVDQIAGPAPQPRPGVTIRLNCPGPPPPGTPQPLYIVNGVQLSGEELIAHGIRPEHIKRIDVVKPAQAIVEYGRAGEHGVILIVTKQAAAGIRRP